MKSGGFILIMCSIESYMPVQYLAPYVATKAALANLTMSFSKFAMGRGVRVNGVEPGPLWASLIPSTMPQDKVKIFSESTVFKCPAMPVEQAAVFVVLASDEASYLTGDVYSATGGRTPYKP